MSRKMMGDRRVYTEIPVLSRTMDRLRNVLRDRHLPIARVGLGGYLLAHYIGLAPYAAETFGRRGVLPDVALNPAYPYGLTVLGYVDSPIAVTLFVTALAALSLAYLVGLGTRTSAVLLFLGSHQLFHRNELTLNPSLPFLGLLLLAHVFLPASQPWSLDRHLDRSGGERSQENRVPSDVLFMLWVVMGTAYTYSGVTKLLSPSWRSGLALEHLLASPLARDTWFVRWVEELPAWILAGFSWGALLIELLAAPLALSRALRPYLWLLLVFMHAGLVTLLDFADISLGMIAFHLFTFDPRWICDERAGASAYRVEPGVRKLRRGAMLTR